MAGELQGVGVLADDPDDAFVKAVGAVGVDLEGDVDAAAEEAADVADDFVVDLAGVGGEADGVEFDGGVEALRSLRRAPWGWRGWWWGRIGSVAVVWRVALVAWAGRGWWRLAFAFAFDLRFCGFALDE